jgi:hypothetical protein
MIYSIWKLAQETLVGSHTFIICANHGVLLVLGGDLKFWIDQVFENLQNKRNDSNFIQSFQNKIK